MFKRIRKYFLKKVGLLDLKNLSMQTQADVARISANTNELLMAIKFLNTIIDSKWLISKSFSPGNWAVDYAFLYTLYRILNDMKPNKILELGLGQSSKMIHQYSHFFNDTQVLTCEHDKSWITFFEKTREGDYVINIQVLELAEIEYKGVKTLAYSDLGKVINKQKYDLIVVDAPYGSPRYSRSNIISLIPNNLSENFCIIIDDCQRTGEQETLEEIREILNKNNLKFVEATYSGSKKHTLFCDTNQKYLTTL